MVRLHPEEGAKSGGQRGSDPKLFREGPHTSCQCIEEVIRHRGFARPIGDSTS